MFKRLSVAQKLIASYAVVLFVVLGLIAAFIFPIRLANQRDDLKKNLFDMTMILSTDPQVQEALKAGLFDEAALDRLDEISARYSATGSLVIVDARGVRLYHSNRTLIGTRHIGKEASRILGGEQSFVTETEELGVRQLRVFQGVRDANGAILGFVTIGDSMQVIHDLQISIAKHLVSVCVGAFAVGMVLAMVISGNIRESLHGNDPSTFASMFSQREDILNHLSEGLVAFDRDGHVVYKNKAGAELFPESVISEEHPLARTFANCVSDGRARIDVIVGIDDRSLLVSAVPVVHEGLYRFALLILRDRTEIVRLNDQVTGSNVVVDALRASMHEFMNQLHVVSGLLQLGESERALQYISETTDRLDAGYHRVARQLKDRAVAALVLGKMSRADELGIDLILREASALPPDLPQGVTQDLVTTVGNLVENAFEAMSGVEGLRQVELGLSCDGEMVEVSVDDTGCGMDQSQIDAIYEGRFSTKGPEHGYGMSLVQEIVRRRGGFLQIDSEPGVGSSVYVVMRIFDKEGTEA